MLLNENKNEDLVGVTFIDKEFLNDYTIDVKHPFSYSVKSILCDEIYVFGSMIHNNYGLDIIPTILGISNNSSITMMSKLRNSSLKIFFTDNTSPSR